MTRLTARALRIVLLLAAHAVACGAAEAPEIRLGRDVVPSFESVRLRLDPAAASYTGSVHVDLNVLRSTRVVRLHAEGERLDRVALTQSGYSIAVDPASGPHGLLTLTAARPLAAGVAQLEIDFTTNFGTKAVGIYRTDAGGEHYAFSQFEAVDARKAFPCWDEPGFKQPWQLTLEVPAGQEAVSNTPPARVMLQGPWKVTEFGRTPPLPSYLLAVAVGPLEYTPVPGTSVPTRIVTVRGHGALTSTAAATVPRILGGLERWFGMPYPFEKLDLIAVPEFAYGAMENAGAITFREALLVMDPAQLTTAQRRSNANTMCHELAHMWFGDLVTMAWWDDLWLNESFADWMAAKVTDEVFPQYESGLDELQGVQGVMAADLQPSTQAIRDSTTGGVSGLANVGLVYKKGDAVLSMFERYLGPEVFQRGVRAYLQAHRSGNATAADLWRALDAASRQDVSHAMATFTDRPGVPMLRVVPAPGGVRITLSRATPFGVAQAEQPWRVPVALRWSDGRATHTARVLLKGPSQLVPLPGGRASWVLPNADGCGYYAWSVPEPMLEELAALPPSATSAAERIAFVGNLQLLLDAGVLHGDRYLRSLQRFGADPEPLVVLSLLHAIETPRRALVPDSLAAPFAAWVRATLRPALERIGLEPREGEPDAVSLLRGELIRTLARDGRDERVLAWADVQAKRALSDTAAVDPATASDVLQLAAMHGDAALFDTLRTRFEATDLPALRARYLEALASFEDPALRDEALTYAFKSTAVRPTEAARALMTFRGTTDASTERVFRWMTANYAYFAGRLPPPSLRMLPGLGGGCSKERLAAAEAFFRDPARAMPGIERSLARVSDDVSECRGLREREAGAVARYLRTVAR